MSNPTCLLVDDEQAILDLLVMTLEEPMGVTCLTAESITKAKSLLVNQPFDMCLTDMRLPDGDGIDLIGHIQEYYPNTPVIVITAHGSVELAVKAMKKGAFDFISKPLKVDELRSLVRSALKLVYQNDRVMASLVCRSAAMQELQHRIKNLARVQTPVCIRGESGSGKEIVAHMIHKLSPRADGPFIPVNCGAIPSELMESEFFGYKKGSFTGAFANKEGLFQSAQGGTLFLDEVAELPLSMQAKLLRAIQEKRILPVGAVKEIPVDVRILSATHQDLEKRLETGEFRSDLFYRINVFELVVPPLRERVKDIPILIEHILNRLRPRDPPSLSESALKALRSYPFPGNVRELENILERTLTLCKESVIDEFDLQLPSEEPKKVAIKSGDADKVFENAEALDPLLNDMERETIRNALEQAKGNKTKAAKLLGINLGALRYRLKKFNIDS